MRKKRGKKLGRKEKKKKSVGKKERKNKKKVWGRGGSKSEKERKRRDKM